MSKMKFFVAVAVMHVACLGVARCLEPKAVSFEDATKGMFKSHISELRALDCTFESTGTTTRGPVQWTDLQVHCRATNDRFSAVMCPKKCKMRTRGGKGCRFAKYYAYPFVIERQLSNSSDTVWLPVACICETKSECKKRMRAKRGRKAARALCAK